MNEDSSLDKMIDGLTEDLAPVKCLGHPLKRIAPWVLISAFYVVSSVYYLGLRMDLEHKFADPHFIFENILMLFTGLSAACASVWLCVPDMRGQKWLPAVPFTFLASFVLWTVARALTEDIGLQPLQSLHCAEGGALMVLVPLVFIVYMSIKGTTTRPYLMAFMNTLAVGALGYIGLRFTCGNDMIGHVFIDHFLPFIALGVLLGIFARHIFKW